MRGRLAVLVLMLSWSAALHAGPKEDALAAYDSFFTRFTTGNYEQIIALFAPDALFYGTSSPELVTSIEGVRAYFTRALTGTAIVKATPQGATALVLSDTAVAISGKWQLERTADGNTVANPPARVTVVMQKRGDRWMIAQFHNSRMPNPPPTTR